MALIKWGSMSDTSFFNILGVNINGWTIIGIGFYGLSFLTYILMISRLKISLAMPIIAGINSCAMVAMGLILFKEKLSIGQMIGIAIVISGIVVVGVFSKK